MEQIDALRAMLADAEYLYTLNDDNLADKVWTSSMVQNLILDVIDYIPALLDAAEMVEAMRWAMGFVGCPGVCTVCPVAKTCLAKTWTEDCNTHVVEHAAEWLVAYREREGT